jgi:hypothetical protein
MNVHGTTLVGSELVGARSRTLVGRLPAGQLTELWTNTASAVVKHGFAVEYRDLAPPRTGIFDGLRIVIDPDVGLSAIRHIDRCLSYWCFRCVGPTRRTGQIRMEIRVGSGSLLQCLLDDLEQHVRGQIVRRSEVRVELVLGGPSGTDARDGNTSSFSTFSPGKQIAPGMVESSGNAVGDHGRDGRS